MDHDPSNVIDINQRAGSNLNDRAAWQAILNAAVLPAFRLCELHLNEEGIGCGYHHDGVQHKNPFQTLYWTGRGSLGSTRMGLLFTYAGTLMRFDLTAMREVEHVRHCTTFFTERFSTEERQLGAKILHRSSFGLGLALQMEKGPVPHVQWYTTPSSRLKH